MCSGGQLLIVWLKAWLSLNPALVCREHAEGWIGRRMGEDEGGHSVLLKVVGGS